MFNKIILNLTKRFYPQGRAFRIPIGSTIEQVHKALAISENIAYESTLTVLDSILPDNVNFTLDDAADWERRLGLITNLSTPFNDRKLAILRKMNHPGTIKARQHYLYVEKSLQDAGFNVFVYENRFLELGVWVTKTPDEVIGPAISGQAVHMFDGAYLEHGQVQHGGGYGDKLKIANSIDKNEDALFNVGSNLRSTFFIGGPTLGSFAIINPSREIEFRQLVLKLKPAHTVAFPFINFVGGDYNDDYNNDYLI
jgi:hypothetical protein